ncbi:MAG: enoyl-CoA hydratase/isomerase family protein [Sphingobium sp.]
MTDYSTILVEKGEDKVAVVTINRPEAMNSFNLAMLDDFRRFWHDVSHDDAVNAILLQASPGRAFCTGVDVKDSTGITRANDDWNAQDPGESLAPKFNRCWKPVVCAVHGMAAGGAFYWLNEADVIIASEDATFFDPHVTYGMTAAVEPIGAIYRMPLGEVLRMALLGNDERISAYTALRIGLVSEVVPNEELAARGRALAAAIAAKPTAATQGTVRAIWESLDLPRSAALQRGLAYTQIGNPVGMAQVDRWSIMGQAKSYTIR